MVSDNEGLEILILMGIINLYRRTYNTFNFVDLVMCKNFESIESGLEMSMEMRVISTRQPKIKQLWLITTRTKEHFAK